MSRFLGEEHSESVPDWDVDFIGKIEHSLAPYKQEFLHEYSKGKDELDKISSGIKYLTTKNVEVQIKRLLQVLGHADSNGNNAPKLIFGGVTINRYKYSDTAIMTQAYLLKDGNIFDLTKVPI
jgi:hypothetical protein